MALLRCQAATRLGRHQIEALVLHTLWPAPLFATVAENVMVYFVEIELVRESDVRCYSAVQQRALVITLLDHIQHLHQRVWAVARSLSGQSDDMTPRQERKGLT